MRFCRHYALIAFGSSLLPAAEFVVCDVGGAVESGPRSFHYEVNNGTTSREGDDTVSSHLGLRVGLAKSFSPRGSSIGPILGGDLVLRRLDLGSGSIDNRLGFEMTPGVGWAPHDRWQILLFGVAGIGIERLSRAASDGYDSANSSGRWTNLGVRLRVQWALKRRWWVGGELGFTDAPGTLAGDGLDQELRSQGFGFALTMMYRIDLTPTRLE